MKFPIPNRTKQPIRHKKDEDGVVDVGWCEGLLSDGRAFRIEMWAQDNISMLTVFFSIVGLEHLEEDAMKNFLEEERLFIFNKNGPAFWATNLWLDDGGNQLWSVNVVVGDDDASHINSSVPIFPYSTLGKPITIFNPILINAAQSKTSV